MYKDLRYQLDYDNTMDTAWTPDCSIHGSIQAHHSSSLGQVQHCWSHSKLLIQTEKYVCSYLWAFHPIFSFFVLVNELTNNENRLVIFCTMFSVCKARQARQKLKIIKKQTNYYVIFSFFETFVNQNKKRKVSKLCNRGTGRGVGNLPRRFWQIRLSHPEFQTFLRLWRSKSNANT